MTDVASRARSGERVTVARTVEELEALREPWHRLQGRHFPNDPDAFLTILRRRPEAIRPHVVLLEQDGEPRSLVLGRVEEVRLSTRLGYRELYAPRVRSITVVNQGVLGDASEGAARSLLAELRGSLARGEADVLRLRNLRLDSPLHRLARTEPSFLRRQHGSRPAVHWELELPSTFDDFLRGLSSSTRESVRRYSRKLTKEYGDRLELRVLREPGEIDTLFRDVETVAAKTYQGGLGVAFSGDELQRSLTALAMERGWFRSWLLYLDGEPCAFWHGEAYRGVFRIGVPGYDPQYAQLRVGTFVLMRLVEDLCADETVDTVDYGFGDAEYKRRFGSRSWQEEDVLVYAPTARAVRINLVRTALLAAVGVARRVLQRGDALGRVKRGWRKRLSRRSAPT
jgi:CelD/BcsL family acetyltransferase involved in cellulose biosynthesis